MAGILNISVNYWINLIMFFGGFTAAEFMGRKGRSTRGSQTFAAPLYSRILTYYNGGYALGSLLSDRQVEARENP